MAGWAGGVFTRARNWAQDKLNAINPQAALFDQEDDNFATGLNNCVTKDGTNKPAANMDFNGNEILGVTNITFSGTATGRGMPISKVKLGNTARTGTTSMTDDPDLASLALVVGKTYFLEMCLLFDASASGGMGVKINLYFTGTFSAGIGLIISNVNGASATTSFAVQASTGVASYSNATIATTSFGNQVLIKMPIEVAGNGSLSMQWAQNTSNGANLTMREGSYLNATLLTT